MTTKQAARQELDRIGDCDYVIGQARAAGRAAETALASWEYLFQTGQYTKARAWWFSEIEPATATEEA